MSAKLLFLFSFLITIGSVVYAAPEQYFRIEVVDDQTSRGVPFVELSTTSGERFFTDSNGLIALDAPELMERPTWFDIRSHGYEFAADGFGFRGTQLTPQGGQSVQLKIKRVNIAERLYRTTGAGIYRDTVLLGKKPPIDEPLLNAQITGQDSVLATIYDDKIFWSWGDTARLSYPLGHFATAAATSELPGKSGLDPSIGINFRYFVDGTGFSKGVVSMDRPGLVWTDGLLTIQDDSGKERLFAHFVRMKDINTLEESGYVVFDNHSQAFKVVKRFDRSTPLAAGSHPFRVNVGGKGYFYFPGVYPQPEAYAHIRVKANWKSLFDSAEYEAYTCLKPGTAYDKDNPPLDRNDSGELVWAWKRNTAPLDRLQLRDLIESGKISWNESPVRLVDVDTGKRIMMNGGSIHWNEFRRHWILISVNCMTDREPGGDVYFAEATSPEGPWINAKKICTHAAPNNSYDFYNPVQHPFFDQDGGRIIYFEGTLSAYFSKNQRAAPRYTYNQLMYRLDLADPRLKLPVPGDTP